jgi:C4-dicarboxylate-specific signal transduction histidine kinase
MQQSHAKRGGGAVELVELRQLLDDAIAMNEVSLAKGRVEVRRSYADVPPVAIDRHKTLEIVINLITNARQALAGSKYPQLSVALREIEDGVAVEVDDNGCGISQDNLNKIFNHGFTTKKDGHGFGLHSSACAAREMGGTLGCSSDGEGRGARFVLQLPRAAAQSAA